MRETSSKRSTNALTMWTSAPPAAVNVPHDPFKLYRAAHRALRGRYPLLILLGLAGVIGGALSAFKHFKPVYRSDGLVRIAFQRAALSDEAEKLRQLAAFEEFLQEQVHFMASRSVVERAFQNWGRRDPRQSTEQQISNFARNLTVLHPVNTEHLTVSFLDGDPAAAAAGVRAVIIAYLELRAADALVGTTGSTEHDEARPELQKEMESLQEMERDIARQFDPAGPRTGTEGTFLQSGQSTDTLINRPDSQDDPGANGPLTINQIGILDPLMRQYLDQKAVLEAELDRLKTAGALDANPHVFQLQHQLQEHNQMMAKYAEDYRKFQLSSRNPLSPVAAGAVDVRHRLAELRLAEADRQITDLKTGGTFAGRVEVISDGDIPLLPASDLRVKAAVAAGLGGGVIMAGAVILLGLARRPLRSADDVVTETGGASLLGILPQLPRGKVTQSRQAVWSFCVHQIRVMLQSKQNGGPSPAYLITSASPGEGKTGLTLALGKSFAQAGVHTLMIDCDGIAQGLTRRVNLSPAVDLFDALRTGTLNGAIHETGNPGLAILPVRGDVEADRFSKASFRRLLDAARCRYDMILIDSGCVLGSVEAALLAPEVDGVILAVTRGQQPLLVDRSIRHLETIGARIVGTVFNRAKFGNLQTSTPAPALGSRETRPVLVAHRLSESAPEPTEAPPSSPQMPTTLESWTQTPRDHLILATGVYPAVFSTDSNGYALGPAAKRNRPVD
jgi:Mrp family chromosome partitioning ATPase